MWLAGCRLSTLGLRDKLVWKLVSNKLLKDVVYMPCVCRKITSFFFFVQAINETSQRLVRRNNNCLEPCLRQMVNELDNILVSSKTA